MKFTWRALVSMICNALGMIGWCYVGGWLTITRPLKGLILAQLAGELSIIKVVLAVAQGFLYLSLAGGIWCVGYMLSDHFKREDE